FDPEICVTKISFASKWIGKHCPFGGAKNTVATNGKVKRFSADLQRACSEGQCPSISFKTIVAPLSYSSNRRRGSARPSAPEYSATSIFRRLSIAKALVYAGFTTCKNSSTASREKRFE